MGRLFSRAIERAGLSELAERAFSGRGLGREDLARLRDTDTLLLAGLADAVRERHRGDEVRLLGSEAARRTPDLLRLDLDGGRSDGPTGEALMREVALARLATPCSSGIAVNFERLGLELAQTALAFGADALFGDLGQKRVLPLLDGPAARRLEITGLIERGGRRVRWVDVQAATLESRS
jgi:2-iminoacetate synthase ThiH